MMLEEYYSIYLKHAEAVPNWKNMNKNVLVNKYLEVEKDPVQADAYISAILCRWWGKMDWLKNISRNSIDDPEIFYSWFIEGILRALRHRVWLNPESSIYNDPNGPEKAINVCIATERKRWYQKMNTKKRKGGVKQQSIEHLQKIGKERIFDTESDEDEDTMGFKYDSINMVQTSFKKGDYVTGFVIDAILNYNVFDKIVEQGKYYRVFNKKRVYKYLRHLNDGSISVDDFAKEYKLPCEEVITAVDKVLSLSKMKLYRAADGSINKLKAMYPAAA